MTELHEWYTLQINDNFLLQISVAETIGWVFMFTIAGNIKQVSF